MNVCGDRTKNSRRLSAQTLEVMGERGFDTDGCELCSQKSQVCGELRAGDFNRMSCSVFSIVPGASGATTTSVQEFKGFQSLTENVRGREKLSGRYG